MRYTVKRTIGAIGKDVRSLSTPRYRHEIKYVIDRFQMTQLDRRLSAVMTPDRHAGEDGTYFIRSLYFDNAQDKALKEKSLGLPRREKFRLRYYNLDPSYIRLEKKSKINRLTDKQSTLITKEECERILAGDIAFLSTSDKELMREFYAKMRLHGLIPKSVVDYTRKTFVCPIADTRITLDYNIRSGIRATDFLNTDLATVPCDAAESEPICILEVKYNEFLPGHIAALLQTPDCRTSPFSKYEISRRFD